MLKNENGYERLGVESAAGFWLLENSLPCRALVICRPNFDFGDDDDDDDDDDDCDDDGHDGDGDGACGDGRDNIGPCALLLDDYADWPAFTCLNLHDVSKVRPLRGIWKGQNSG